MPPLPGSHPPRPRTHRRVANYSCQLSALHIGRVSWEFSLAAPRCEPLLAAKSDCMDYEEELDDNGVLRIRRVASPFVPIRDEREAPPMAFDDDQMKAFRMVTLRKLQNQTRGARLTLCPPLATDLRPLRRNALRSCHRLHPNRRYGHSAPLRWPEPNPDRTRRPLRGGESGRPLS